MAKFKKPKQVMSGTVPMLQAGDSCWVFDRERELRFRSGEEVRPEPNDDE